MHTALLLSGGSGMRLQSRVPKQYIRVEGRMVITYSLEILVNSPLIHVVWIVAGREWREEILADAKQYGINNGKIIGFSDPGNNRQASILKGLEDIVSMADGVNDGEFAKKKEDNLVMIHDAARPLLTDKQIQECFVQMIHHDGVMPVLPMRDTVYLSEDGGCISQLLERGKIFAGQAPEIFQLEKYYQANLALKPDQINKINGSTEPAIMAGMDIAMIPGDENNFKITTKRDLERFQDIIGRKTGSSAETERMIIV